MNNLIKLAALGLVAASICFFARSEAQTPKTDSIVVAGGCFWGVQSVFEHTKGVTSAVSGYAGGRANTAQYDMVSSGTTGHAESVLITYDPATISLSQLLDIYFTVAHNPTELNYQGPDHGTQYRSEVFYSNAAQQQAVQNKIAELKAKRVYTEPIVTKVAALPLQGFYPAEQYHQHYAALHPMNLYIVINDAPKVAQLKKSWPALYKN